MGEKLLFVTLWGVLTMLGGTLILQVWPDTGPVFVWGMAAGALLLQAVDGTAKWLRATQAHEKEEV